MAVVSEITYKKLLKDLRQLIVADSYYNWEIIENKHKIGRKISTELRATGHGEKEEFFSRLSKDLDYAKTELHLCVQFVRQFPDIDSFKKQFSAIAEISWYKLRTEILPAESKRRKLEQSEAIRERMRSEYAASKADLPNGIALLHGDFREICPTLKESSVDMIFTDPYYSLEYLQLYPDVVKEASRLLKFGGSLFVMTGQSYLPRILHSMDESCSNSLHYHWEITMLLTFNQSNSIFPQKVLTAHKPVYWFVKGKYEGDWHHDVIGSDKRDKTLDDMQQNVKGIRQLIEFYSKPGDLILDPMMDTGTTGIAAVSQGRRFTGIDIEEEKVKVARGRIAESLK